MKNRKKFDFLSKRLFGVLRKEKRTREYVNAMFVRGDREKELFDIWQKRVGIVVLLLIVCGLAWVYCFTTKPEDSILSGERYIVRQMEDETVDLQVSGKSDIASWEKKISLLIKPKEFSEKEKKQIEKTVEDYVGKTLPGKNPSLKKVTKALNFVTEVPGTEAELKWTWDEQYIKDSGSPIAAAIPKQGVDTEIMLEASWKNWRKVFHFMVHIDSRVFTEEERAIQDVKRTIKNVLKDRAEDAVVELPGQVGSTEITYWEMGEEKSYLAVYLCIGVILFMPFVWREQQKKKLAEREEQMLMEHPGIVNKVMLLLSAGLTVRKAVERLSMEYEEERKKGGSMRYAYEEICVMLQEMKDGISEGIAMERFGRRCRLFPYLRFSSVITQNLKKGAEGIIDILEKESMEALEQRKSRVLKMGEVAGTKLLFPMMLMLGLVMGIIMVPAFMTM